MAQKEPKIAIQGPSGHKNPTHQSKTRFRGPWSAWNRHSGHENGGPGVKIQDGETIDRVHRDPTCPDDKLERKGKGMRTRKTET